MRLLHPAAELVYEVMFRMRTERVAGATIAFGSRELRYRLGPDDLQP